MINGCFTNNLCHTCIQGYTLSRMLDTANSIYRYKYNQTLLLRVGDEFLGLMSVDGLTLKGLVGKPFYDILLIHLQPFQGGYCVMFWW